MVRFELPVCSYTSPPVSVPLLRDALRLPSFDGRAAQRLMEPARHEAPPHFAAAAPRPAAALACVFPQGEGLYRPLTVRRPDLPEHKGQVSLPGGRPEAGEDLWETARREAYEEVGIEANGLEHLGVLAPVPIPVTHTLLHVYVALRGEAGALVACPREVERIVLVSLDDLLDPARRRVRRLTIAGREVDVPYFDVAGLFLWGATAMALSELVERIRTASMSVPDRSG